MLSPSLVILSEAKNPFHSALGVDFAKHPLLAWKNNGEGFFASLSNDSQRRACPEQSEGLRMTASEELALSEANGAQNDNARQFFICLLKNRSTRGRAAPVWAAADAGRPLGH